MQIHEAAAGTVKTAALALGTYVAGMSDGIPAEGKFIAWLLTVIYGALQIIKCLPWFTDYCRTFWKWIRFGQSSGWWKIAKRNEEGSEDKE